MNSLSQASTNGKATAPNSPNWLLTPVQAFFTGINWEMNPLEVQQVKQAVILGSNQPLPLTFTVQQFFSCIAWEGGPATPPPPDTDVALLSSLETAKNEFTLDDFSSLF